MGNQDLSECTPCQLGQEGYLVLWDECYSIENTTELDLSYSQLTGEIPPQIGDLVNLEWLDLLYNQFTNKRASKRKRINKIN